MIFSAKFQVFNIGQSHVTGLKFFRVPATNNYVVLATSEDKLFKYQETVKGDDRSPFQGIFSAYLNVPEHVRDFQSTAHPSKATTSKLRVCYDNKTHFPRSFGWLTDSGIFFGDMDPLSETPAHIVTNAIIPFPELITPMGQKTFPAPIAFTLTDFHALLVFPDRLCAVSLLNYQTVYEEYINETFGPLLNAIRDPRENVIYVYTKKVIFRIKVTNEQRNAWQIYLDKGEFEYALKYAHDNPLHRDTILTKQAEMSFDSKDFQRAAEIFAETKFSFEGICLKFLAVNENGALMTYLRRRLIDQGANDTIQITMLVVWLVELYLTEKARNSGNSVKVSELERNFDEFMELKPVKECIKRHKTVVYDLIASHGDNQYLAKLNAGSQDFESVINQYIDQNKFVDALKILRNQKQADSFYKYGPILMEDIPKETVHALMEQRSLLEPVKLIPTLICLESQTHIEEVIRYLEFSVLSLNCRDQAVHNYLIKLYTEHMPEKLMTYLETQGKDHTIIQYDLHYALRICREKSCNMASVFLQCLIGMWHEAVELALTFDSSLAERTASMPKDKELKRKLWLRIAEHEIKDKKDNVTEALKLLKTCDLLRIEDILPFFSDFHKIDDFKEAICDALKEYNLTILEQKRDMEESAKAADRVRADLQHFRNRSVAISSSDLCAICGTFVLARPFFIFPCGHKFHLDCLEKQARNHMDKEHCVKLVHLRQRLNPESADFPRLKAEYERTLAAECFHCGEVMISAIDEPFVSNWERINADWE